VFGINDLKKESVSYWLDKLVEEVVLDTSQFWMKVSLELWESRTDHGGNILFE